MSKKIMVEWKTSVGETGCTHEYDTATVNERGDLEIWHKEKGMVAIYRDWARAHEMPNENDSQP